MKSIPTSFTQKTYEDIIQQHPKDRVAESSGDDLYDTICGILIAFAYHLNLRNGHIDIITVGDAVAEIKNLINHRTMGSSKKLLKAFAEIAYDQLHDYESGIDLQDVEAVSIKIFNSFIGQKMSEVYKQISGIEIEITHGMNLWEGNDQTYVKVIEEVIEEYDEQ